MQKPKDHIIVGAITLTFNQQQQGWEHGDQIIKNPLKAQRIAERIHLRDLNIKGHQHD
ncbi:DUF1317 family protein [Pantoea sp. GCM10028869]|uniref:DUF1317 family protein n=1 Tax=Pantoea sp. GCM10028869 TaxID=3273417 RepID=UPI003622CC0A